MPTRLITLDAMPSAADFYGLYWNRQPFVVRGAITNEDIEALISADELAGLSMEDAPQSRMVKSAGDHENWSCRFGPFSEGDFAVAGEADWSLLVQNVEQFHPDTAELLHHFNFAPRWLMDDIMISYSATGGSIGPHIDSYHVFLVQGQGKRRWRVGREPIQDEVYVEGVEFKLLKHGFEGDTVEVNCGDVLYLPPRFGHEGTTLENAMTFSVGFLGPKTSDLLIGYGQYLSQFDDLDQRYVGEELANASAGFTIDQNALGSIRERMTRPFRAKAFSAWVVEFFTESSHDDFGNYVERDDPISVDMLIGALKDGACLIKPPFVKFVLTANSSGEFYLGFDRHSFALDEDLLPVAHALMKERAVCSSDHPELFQHCGAYEFLCELYNHEALEFTL